MDQDNSFKMSNKKIFKDCCPEIFQIIAIHATKLIELRQALYGFVKLPTKKIKYSQIQEDISLLQNLISNCRSILKQYILSCTIRAFYEYQDEFKLINQTISTFQQKMDTEALKHYLNTKMYHKIIKKINLLKNYYNS
ncbi:hypothetical protein ABPG74_014699 [Tetrahymena malaccensis]